MLGKVKLLIESQTSEIAPLKFMKRKVISHHTIIHLIFIQAGIKINPFEPKAHEEYLMDSYDIHIYCEWLKCTFSIIFVTKNVHFPDVCLK